MSSRFMIKKSVLSLCRTAILCAVALVLAVFENMIPPLPFVLPGMKLGLSNIVVMFSLELCSLPASLSVAVVKALFALVTRGAVAFMMSFAGGVLACLVMYILLHSDKLKFGCLGIGIGGAFMHNMGQFLVSFCLMGNAVLWYLPVLCVSALASGALTALVFYVVMPSVNKIPVMRNL